MGKVPEVGMQRFQNDCNPRHAQGRKARTEANRETCKYRRGNFGVPVTTKQRNCFDEHQGGHDRSDEGCKQTQDDRQAEADNPRVQNLD